MLDGLPRLTDRLGESLLFIEGFPLAAFVELDEMTQGAARGEQLPLGILALDVDGQGFGHRVERRHFVICSVIKSGKDWINP
jgi:hypothetical protein